MEEKENLRISVRNLVEFILRSGDIDNRHAGAMEKDAMQEGSRIHRKIQGKMGSCYQAEVPLSIEIEEERYILKVEGRADGIFREKSENDSRMRGVIWMDTDTVTEDDPEQSQIEPVYIDEIKGMYRDVLTLEAPYPIHLAQAKCYAYFYGKKENLERIGVQMTYCSLETEEERRFRRRYTMESLERWFETLIQQYQKWAEYQICWKETRQASIQGLAFPFSWRKGQKDVAAAVYRTMLRRKNLFIQAPTGTGKTISTVYPAVKAVGEGLADRIFYATAKTITRTVAEEAFALLREKGLQMKTITLTAKEKICFQEETECNPDACPYAKGHFDRVNDAVFDLLGSGEQQFNRQTIESYAQKWKVCPFEFGLDVALWGDGVICDYNYIFDPRAKLKRFFGEGVKGDYLFLIDEAHNLVERGREMFSASLYKEDFLELKKMIQPYSKKMARALQRCNAWMLERKRECEGVKIWPDVGMLPVYLTNLCGIMEDFLEDSRNAEINEKVLDLYFQVRSFLDTCDQLNENYVVYTELQEEGRFLTRLFCVDISGRLQECLDKGRSTIYFSATFLPIQYYRKLLSARTDDYAIYAQSTFDPQKRQILIGTDTSSRYTNRNEREYRKMAEYIQQMIRIRRGNYMIFFPSYRMMEAVAEQFSLLCEEREEPIELLCQQTGMSETEREEFLHYFEESHEMGLAGFCVMGGVFGEGIDLKEDRLIGAVIVGTGIPQVCQEREILKCFYDKRGEDGFFYAYLCPGMNKVLQSAGRVIRTEADTGIILLLDSRFSSPVYRQMFPEEWQRLDYCTLNSVGQKTAAFWNSLQKIEHETNMVE